MKQIILFLFIYNFTIAQSDVPLTLRAQFNGSYGYKIIGNTHNEFDNWQFPTPPCQMQTSPSSSLNLLTNLQTMKLADAPKSFICSGGTTGCKLEKDGLFGYVAYYCTACTTCTMQ